MKKDINKIITEVLASLALEKMTVSQKKIDETKKLVLRKENNNDGRR